MYPAKTITDANYADDIALLTNALAQGETLLPSSSRHSPPFQGTQDENMFFNKTGDISTKNSSSLNGEKCLMATTQECCEQY